MSKSRKSRARDNEEARDQIQEALIPGFENPNPINTSNMKMITGTLLNKAIAQLNLKDKTCLVVIKNAIDISEKYNLGQTDDFEKLRDMMMKNFQI